ncbi:recombinase family protein [Streptomyces sp. B21-105]|uniref:recombinase family protein n=1 Tax=Streptomyces sp. B21-105 TaxID=3039417 RepID=UPI002FF257A9
MEISRKPTARRRRTVARVSNYAIGYLRVSTAEQVKSGAGLDAQRTAITACAAARGLEVIAWHVDEGVSGGTAPMKRPELSKALDALATGPASVLLFGKADRVGRRATDLLALRDRAEREGWTLASADGAVDLTSPHGKLMFTMLAGVAEMERDLIRARTREGLAAKREQGVRLGRPSVLPESVVRRIVEEREGGAGWTAIARGLMDDGVPTARGGATWHPSAVQKVYNGQDAAKVSA